MKKLLLLLFVFCGIIGYAQYDGDKLPSGLTVSLTAADADYTIIQKSGEVIVKAIRMDSLRSYMTEQMAANVIELDSIDGETGQFIISDGTGWLTTASAKYKGGDAYNFGYRAGSVGSGSFVFQGFPTAAYNNTASNTHAFVWGRGNTASGNASTCWGTGSTASGWVATAFGTGSTASGSVATAFGNGSTASGVGSLAGSGGTASSLNSIAFSGGVASDTSAFAIGTGSEASGDYSIAGAGGTASGNYSVAFASGTSSGESSSSFGGGVSSGDYSMSWGSDPLDPLKPTASGDRSTAWGNNATASGIGSTAWGYSTIASGNYSTAWGNNITIASGNYSTAWGNNITAQSYLETCFGQYTDTAASKTATSWVATDRLFTISNGTGSGSRSNALVMLKNGNTTVTGEWSFTEAPIIGTSTEVAAVTNVGKIRYRADANNSWCEMVMQTGSSTYAWVVLKTNTW
jgi:hypothetical protein